MTPGARRAAELVSALGAWIDRLFPAADRGERLNRTLADRFAGEGRPVTAELCREVEAVAHRFARHLTFDYVADGSLVPDTSLPAWPLPDPSALRLRAGSVGE